MNRDPSSELKTLEEAHLRRRLRAIGSQQGAIIEHDGKSLINFASNDYLGFATEPELIDTFQAALSQWGVGSGSSRLLAGSLPPHRQLEERIAAHKGTARALCFSSGYAASVGTLGALLRAGDWVILDKLAHASLIDGARLSGATLRVFPHNRLDKLEELLNKATLARKPDSRIIVVTEGIFSMDGDACPLAEIIELKNRFGAWLMLDEAHSYGVFGQKGAGLAAELGLSGQIELQLGTFSKAAGLSGAYLAADSSIVELLINRSRSFIYSTAPPPALAATTCRAIDLIEGELGAARREHLFALRQHFTKISGISSESAIIPYPIGEANAALEASRQLEENAGILAPAVRYPTVPRKQARLRLSLSAAHQIEHIEQLHHALVSL